jgi:hypothetical protein
VTRERELWWLNPAWVVGIMGSLLVLAAYIVPDSMYRNYWKTPKYFDPHAALITLACIGMFVFGAVVGSFRRSHIAAPQEDAWADGIAWKLTLRVFNASFYLTIVGYVVWAGVAVSRGANLALALGVLHGDKGASYVMKEVYMGTVSGVTTLTQLGIVCMVLAVLIGRVFGWRRVVFKCAIVLLLALVRALMNSERLAVMELLVPAIALFMQLIVLGSQRFQGRLWPLLKAAPVVGYTGLIGVFGASEYFRSWINFYQGGDLSFWQFVSLRLLGYYVTALNNGALLIQRIEPTGAPFLSLHVLWRAPLLGGVMNALYPNLALASVETDPYMRYLTAEANPEFNNGGGFFLPIIDFGLAGALLYWVLAGVMCGILYRMFQQRRPAGLLLYPITFTSVIELSRIVYWAEGRVLLPMCVLTGIALACSYYNSHKPISANIAAKEPQWQPSH